MGEIWLDFGSETSLLVKAIKEISSLGARKSDNQIHIYTTKNAILETIYLLTLLNTLTNSVESSWRFCEAHVPNANGTSQSAGLRVEAFLQSFFATQNEDPPVKAKSAHLGNRVACQKVTARPGQAAAFRPAALMYQLLQPAEKTVSSRTRSRSWMNCSSDSCLTSTTSAYPSRRGLKSTFAMYATWTSME